jgi:hypothetical protein
VSAMETPESTDAPVAPAAPEPPAPSPPLPSPPARATREYRAKWTFAIAAAFGIVVLALFSQSLTAFPATAVAGAVLSVVVAALEAWGLSERRDWARFAMTPLLWIFVATGLLQFVVSLATGSFNIPVGAILAAWALSARPSDALGPMPRSSTAGVLLVVASIGSALFSLF